MKKLVLIIFPLSMFAALACSNIATINDQIKEIVSETFQTSELIQIIDTSGYTIESRFKAPQGFERVQIDSNSFGVHLRNLPLKPSGSLVNYYNGATKDNGVYDAVVDLPIGKRNLHQCADAVMRLKADYLYQSKQYDKIHFNFTNGFRVDYKEWRKGRRVVINGNKTYWNNRNSPSNSPTSYWKYMELIFSYAGTLSLAKEMKTIEIDQAEIGDVFIQGGSPGHAIIIVDMTQDSTGNKQILLAQSYMPAQEIQILKNPNSKEGTPWYNLDFGETLNTPEWTFYKNDLKRFKD